MAGSSLLILLDDITLMLDDVAAMSKIAARKTAGVLGDDLALNAQQVCGIRAERELPVVWAVAKGSVVNKFILVPAALAISAVLPAAVTPLLMLGGAYLCFEGVEKLAHPLLHSHAEDEAHHAELTQALTNESIDLVAFEQDKIKGAVRTDFILSAEIVAISLGTVADAPFSQQLLVVGGVALLVTAGVYGLVAAIVKMDDVGLYLQQRGGKVSQAIGGLLLAAAPKLMKVLSVVGTAAMFLVGGGIVLHGLPGAHALMHAVEHGLASVPVLGPALSSVAPLLAEGLGGVVVGAVTLAVVTIAQRLWGRLRGR